jgi:DNA polymerase V
MTKFTGVIFITAFLMPPLIPEIWPLQLAKRQKTYRPSVLFHKSGVGAIELVNKPMYQRDMFSVQGRVPRVMAALDSINQRFSPDSISVAAKGIQGKWQMRREMKSPSYTSSWLDMVRISCSDIITR